MTPLDRANMVDMASALIWVVIFAVGGVIIFQAIARVVQ
jgi:hypothetical protein